MSDKSCWTPYNTWQLLNHLKAAEGNSFAGLDDQAIEAVARAFCDEYARRQKTPAAPAPASQERAPAPPMHEVRGNEDKTWTVAGPLCGMAGMKPGVAGFFKYRSAAAAVAIALDEERVRRLADSNADRRDHLEAELEVATAARAKAEAKLKHLKEELRILDIPAPAPPVDDDDDDDDDYNYDYCR